MRVLVGVAVVCSWAMVAPPRVSACSFVIPYAALVWPRDGASDVPRDTPLVVVRMDFFGDAIDYALLDPNGDPVPLEQVHELPPAYPGCPPSEVLFLRSEEPLEPNATYTMQIDPEVDSEGQLSSTFTTGVSPTLAPSSTAASRSRKAAAQIHRARVSRLRRSRTPPATIRPC